MVNKLSYLVATDLDGTLLNDRKQISKADLNVLCEIQRNGVVNVAATGRNMNKVKDVLHKNIPFDYIVFSSGAGVYNWKDQVLLNKEVLENKVSQNVVDRLRAENCNFIVFDAIPNNNRFKYFYGGEDCAEFNEYISSHRSDCTILENNEQVNNVGQLLVVIPNNEESFYQFQQAILSTGEKVKIIRATSPINDNYIWLEIFPINVSKAFGLNWICEREQISKDKTIAIGNDYNDEDMFEFVQNPFVVKNGVEVLKQKYKTLQASNNENPLSEVVKAYFIDLSI